MLKTKESESYPVFNNKIGNHEKLSPLLKLNDIAKIFLSNSDYSKDGQKTYYKYTMQNYMKSNWNEVKAPTKQIYSSYFKSDFYHSRKSYGHLIAILISQYKRAKHTDTSRDKWVPLTLAKIEIRLAHFVHLLTSSPHSNIHEADYQSLDSQGIITPRDIHRVKKLAWGEKWNFVDFSLYVNGSGYSDLEGLKQLAKLTFVHDSLSSPSKVAYYRNMADLKRGREIVTSVGKYLARFSDYLSITDKEVKLMTDNYLTAFKGFGDLSLEYIDGLIPGGDSFAVNREIIKNEWVIAYKRENTATGEHGFKSCMTDLNCVNVYANPKSDLRLALLVDQEGIIYSRAIVRTGDTQVNPESVKGYIRIYPSPSENRIGNYMKQLLSADGYNEPVNFNYCYFDSIWLDSYEAYQVPYIDGGEHEVLGGKFTFGEEVTIDGREYLHVNNNDEYISFENTNGRSNTDYDEDDEDYTYCCECEERVQWDDTRSDDHDRTYCDNCYETEVSLYVVPRLRQLSVSKFGNCSYLGTYDCYMANPNREPLNDISSGNALSLSDGAECFYYSFDSFQTHCDNRPELLHAMGLAECVFSDSQALPRNYLCLSKYGYISRDAIWNTEYFVESGSPKYDDFQTIDYPTRIDKWVPLTLANYDNCRYLYQLAIDWYEDKDIRILPNGKTCAIDNPDFFYIY